MEKLRNKKILSECSNVPCSLHLRPGDHISSVEKVDDCSPKHTSNSPTKNGSTNALLRTPSTMKTRLVEDHLVPLGNATCLTPNTGEAEARLNGDQIPGQVTPSIDFSVLSAADFGITPESFTSQRKGESKSLLKKFRRRSAIGARGSPENNSLIQYIACQKRTRTENPPSQIGVSIFVEQLDADVYREYIKISPLACRLKEQHIDDRCLHLQRWVSPFKPHNMLLKDKIAAFQSSFKPLEETEERPNQTYNTSKNGGAGPLEQSMFGQGWNVESKIIAVEEHLNNPSVSGERTSADLPACNMVSPSQKPFVFASIQSQCINEKLSSSSASQQSCKKVRFAEKKNLEIFDQSKLPITPLQKGQFPSSVLYHDGTYLRSALKKPPEHFDYSSSRKGREAPLAFEICGLQQIESNTGPVNETEEDYNDLDTTLSLVPTPLLRADPRSPSGSRNYSAITPIKQPLPQPNFDSQDDLVPASLTAVPTAVPTTEYAVNSDLEGTNSSPEPQGTCCRITRSSRKRKLVRTAKADTHLSTERQSKRVPAKKVEKAISKKQASRHKVFGKRRRKKKEQKALYGKRETVSRKPLLSPIPEMKEDLSFVSYQSTHISILDYSDSSDACVEYMDKIARKENGALQIPSVVSNDPNLSLDLVKENALPDIKLVSSQLTVVKNGFPCDPPEKNSPVELKSSINTNQMLETDCSSNETKMQKELEFLGADATDKKNASRGELDLAGDSALELTSEGVRNRNFKRFPRRSRRLSHSLPNIDDDDGSKTPGNNSCVPRNPLPTPHTVNDSVLLNDLQHSIEESFKCVPHNDQKRVRRSMRRLKDADNSGLVWINIPADSSPKAILSCANKAQKQTCPSSLEELECPSQKQDSFYVLLPMKEEKENVPVTVDPCRSKAGRRRRRSICALGLEENQNVVLSSWRNRRASLGYKSDQIYRQDSEMRKLLVKQPTVI